MAALPKSRNPNETARYLTVAQESQSLVRNPAEALEPIEHAT
jgi:hypothetical protein